MSIIKLCITFIISVLYTSPGIRKYTYDISHNPEGRDFTVNFNPFIPPADFTENTLQNRNGFQDPQDYDQMQLNVQAPLPQDQERSNKNIQAVHAAYGKSPGAVDDFDLGIMGYGDFMDGPDIDLGISPKAAPILVPEAFVESRYPKLPSLPVHKLKPYKFQPVRKAPFSPPKKFNFQKPQFIPEYGQKQIPKVQYGFKPVKELVNIPTGQPLFVPVQGEGHLQGLGDKAYSKVFMTQGHSKDVVKLYPKTPSDFRKTLFVPVVFLPGSSQAVPGSHLNDIQKKPFAFKSS